MWKPRVGGGVGLQHAEPAYVAYAFVSVWSRFGGAEALSIRSGELAESTRDADFGESERVSDPESGFFEASKLL